MTNTTEKTLITPFMAQVIISGFEKAIKQAKADRAEFMGRDASMLEKFGLTTEALLAAGLPSQSKNTLRLKYKLQTLEASLLRFKWVITTGQVFLEDQIQCERDCIWVTREEWDDWKKTANPEFLAEFFEGSIKGHETAQEAFQLAVSPRSW